MTYEEWLKKNGYIELASYDPAIIVARKDGMPIWEDEKGHKFIGLCNKKLFEAGVEEATKEMQNEIKKLREQSFSDVYNLQREIDEKDVIIKFLKKELAHKSSYRQVMKRQYKELKDKYNAIAPKERYLQNQLITEMVVSGWSEEEKEELLKKWKEINKRHRE